jgi:predicted nucleic acid-binding protein
MKAAVPTKPAPLHTVLLDTGPLVAWLCRGDRWHRWAVDTFATIPPPLVTCEAVLTEACFLYAREGGAPGRLLAAVEAGHIRIGLALEDEAAAIAVLLAKYSDAPMSLADACVVRLSEVLRNSRVLTLDRHFTRYRRFGRSVIPLLCPWSS